jgi:hypothetical protein
MKLNLFFILFFSNFLAYGQKQLTIPKMEQAIKIDGEIKSEWNSIPFESGFTQNYPKTGEPCTQKTKFKMAYDNTSLYIAAILYDFKDSINYQFSERDDFGNGDYFGVIIDPYQGGNNGFGYFVTAAGVQRDAYYFGEDGDGSWNSVWESKTTKTDSAWIVEIQIPFSAIRFPREDIQTWNINFIRQIRRNRENAYWNPVDPEKFGLLNQFAVLNGIEGVKPPVRLSFSPYASTYARHYPDPNAKNWDFGYGLGMDLKYGITDAFTLDMTLVPDFSQVRSDDQVLNLSPFEVRFNENRQFFTEGMELYNIGEIFYTRRIGGRPLRIGDIYNEPVDTLGEYVSKNPAETQLINATKLTGRTKQGLGVGVFNAITNRTTGVVSDSVGGARNYITDPWTNYNAFSISQNLPNNSVVSFMNTNVTREGNFYDANVSVIEGRYRNKPNSMALGATAKISHLYSPAINNETGYSFGLNAEKTSGNVQGEVYYEETSDKYNINDMGFQYRNNEREIGASVGYYTFKKFGRFYRTRMEFEVSHSRLYNPDRPQSLDFDLSANGTFLNFMAAGLNFNARPVGEYDYYEPRYWGKKYFTQPSYNFGGWISSDYSKLFAFDLRSYFRQYVKQNRFDVSAYLSPRLRAGNMFFLVYSLNYQYSHNQEGYAFYPNDDLPDESVFGKRHTHTVTNTLTIDFRFTNRMGINLRVRHYWARVGYNSFYLLNDEGTLDYYDYDGLDGNGESLHDINYNAFTVDLVYKWVFQPGSELSVVWKNAIYTNEPNIEANFFNNFGDMITSPATNTISVKLLYYLDVLYFKKWSQKKKEH